MRTGRRDEEGRRRVEGGRHARAIGEGDAGRERRVAEVAAHAGAEGDVLEDMGVPAHACEVMFIWRRRPSILQWYG